MNLSSVVHSILIKNAVSVNQNPPRRRMFRARRVAPATAIAPAGRDACRSGITAGAWLSEAKIRPRDGTIASELWRAARQEKESQRQH
jgi:hypothetical protein